MLTEVTLELRSGEDPETVARRYPNSGWGSASHRDGTVTLYVHTPIEVEALERPEALAPVVIRFRNDEPVLSGTYTPKLFVFDRRPGWFQVRRRGEVVSRGQVRRAKLYYLRKLRGKAARIREKKYIAV